MKLVRYGESGQEKPGILDAQGQLRDLSAHVADIGGQALTPKGLEALRAIEEIMSGQPGRLFPEAARLD